MCLNSRLQVGIHAFSAIQFFQKPLAQLEEEEGLPLAFPVVLNSLIEFKLNAGKQMQTSVV